MRSKTDSIINRIPLSLGKVHKPRQLGLLIMALEQGPANVHEIQNRLKGKYRFYPAQFLQVKELIVDY